MSLAVLPAENADAGHRAHLHGVLADDGHLLPTGLPLPRTGLVLLPPLAIVLSFVLALSLALPVVLLLRIPMHPPSRRPSRSSSAPSASTCFSGGGADQCWYGWSGPHGRPLAPLPSRRRTLHSRPPSPSGSSFRVRAKSVYDARGDPTASQSQASFSHPPASHGPHYPNLPSTARQQLHKPAVHYFTLFHKFTPFHELFHEFAPHLPRAVAVPPFCLACLYPSILDACTAASRCAFFGLRSFTSMCPDWNGRYSTCPRRSLSPQKYCPVPSTAISALLYAPWSVFTARPALPTTLLFTLPLHLAFILSLPSSPLLPSYASPTLYTPWSHRRPNRNRDEFESECKHSNRAQPWHMHTPQEAKMSCGFGPSGTGDKKCAVLERGVLVSAAAPAPIRAFSFPPPLPFSHILFPHHEPMLTHLTVSDPADNTCRRYAGGHVCIGEGQKPRSALKWPPPLPRLAHRGLSTWKHPIGKHEHEEDDEEQERDPCPSQSSSTCRRVVLLAQAAEIAGYALERCSRPRRSRPGSSARCTHGVSSSPSRRRSNRAAPRCGLRAPSGSELKAQSTSRFARLASFKTAIAGWTLFVRFASLCFAHTSCLLTYDDELLVTRRSPDDDPQIDFTEAKTIGFGFSFGWVNI
ncbi:hypothetical protein B0H13DRAFT_2346406 [Mycena leptocephala]|nr:hypothetical protein B0H13DRAFT_2346406 [Mycena leptocephala]